MESGSTAARPLGFRLRLAGVIDAARRRQRRRRRWMLWAAGLAAAITVGSLESSGGGARRATVPAANGDGQPPMLLRPGQALRTRIVAVDAARWPNLQPTPGGGFLGTSGPTFGLVAYRQALTAWSAYDGTDRTQTNASTGPQFIGSAGMRDMWERDFRAHQAAWILGFGNPRLVGGKGPYRLGGRPFTYQQLLDLPRSPAQLARAIRDAAAPAGADPITVVLELLTGVSLPAGEEAAIVQAARLFPGVRYQASFRDPIGRLGAALITTPKSVPGQEDTWRTQQVLVFNPITHAFLAEGGQLVSRTNVNGVGVGFWITSRVYLSSTVVPTSTLPRLG